MKLVYIHHFILFFPGYITNQYNDHLPVGLLPQLVSAAQVSKSLGFESRQTWIFQAFFSQLHKLPIFKVFRYSFSEDIPIFFSRPKSVFFLCPIAIEFSRVLLRQQWTKNIEIDKSQILCDLDQLVKIQH